MTIPKIDLWGRVIVDEEQLLELFYRGINEFDNITVEDNVIMQQYNNLLSEWDNVESMVIINKPLTQSPEEYHAIRQNTWFIPDEYKQINITDILLSRCTTIEQENRVRLELSLFEKYQMADVLRFLIYAIATLREHNVVWGVGRGSSVASYILFLIGVHKVDSLKYDLDINEFLHD